MNELYAICKGLQRLLAIPHRKMIKSLPVEETKNEKTGVALAGKSMAPVFLYAFPVTPGSNCSYTMLPVNIYQPYYPYPSQPLRATTSQPNAYILFLIFILIFLSGKKEQVLSFVRRMLE